MVDHLHSYRPTVYYCIFIAKLGVISQAHVYGHDEPYTLYTPALCLWTTGIYAIYLKKNNITKK